MLKTRVIATLLWDDLGCVKGRKFNPDRRVGSMMQQVRVYDLRQIDELIILDIAATPADRRPRFNEISEFASELFCPLTVGGGVRSISDIGGLLASGADKVSICTAAMNKGTFLQDACRKFGSQAIVGAIDVIGEHVAIECGKLECWTSPVDWAMLLEDQGVGEILLTSVDRDGTMEGYDLDTVYRVAAAVDIPVIANGGCGSYEDMLKVLRETKAHAVAASSMFLFTEREPRGAKEFLASNGIKVRLP